MKAILSSGAFMAAAEAFRRVQSNASATGRPAGRAAASNRMPMNANATPTEHMMRYFQVASRLAADTCVQMRKAVKSVVASTPTQAMARLLEIRTRIMAARAPSQRAPNRRARAGVKCPPASSRVKYVQA